MVVHPLGPEYQWIPKGIIPDVQCQSGHQGMCGSRVSDQDARIRGKGVTLYGLTGFESYNIVRNVMQEKLVDLESRLAFQEHTLQALNDVIASQQQEIQVLRLALQDLDQRMRAMAPASLIEPGEEGPPPHY